MNKLASSLLLVGLFAVAVLARTSPQIRRPFRFTPGQTYIYEYRGRQWNGITQISDQYAGLTLECDIILQALPESAASGKEVLLKLDDIKVEQLHTQTLANNDIRKLNQGQEQNQRQTAMYKEELSKPIRFTYLDGRVVRFIAEAGDAEWSINIKKSLLSMFQLDLAPTKVIKSSTKQLSELVYGYNSEDVIQTTNEMPLIYPIYEESFGGICETLYEIDSVDNVEDRDQQEFVEFNDVLNVTKTVNYKNCLTDPSVSYDRHSFSVNTQTTRGKLFTKQPTVTSQNYYPVPDEMKSKYANSYTSPDHKDNVASPVPVERYSYTKYNIATAPQSLVNRRSVPVSSPADMILIESVYSEGKIKYQVDGDTLVSDTQQNLKLVSCSPTSDLARVAPEISTLAATDVRQPSTEYHTIQCELNAQKARFYQALLKYAQLHDAYKQNSISNSASSPALYSHQLILPYALSASWYPIVATGQQSSEQSVERSVDPEQLGKSYEHLLYSLADDVLSEDVAQSKKAGEKVIRLVNIVSFMPKYKLAEIHDRIVDHIQQAKKAQAQSRGKQAVVDNDQVNKYKVIRKLYLDSLPLAGSKQAIEMIEVLVAANRLKSYEAKEMCEAVPTNLRYPDTEIIDAFVRISQLPYVRKNRSLFASCSIAVGKMIGQAYAKSKDASYKPTTYEQADKLPTHLREDEIIKQVAEEADPRRQLPYGWNSSPDSQEIYERLVLNEQDLMKYVKLYKQMLNKASQQHEKIIYIETLAHMKVPQVLPVLEPYATGRISLAQCLGNQPLDIVRPVEQSQWFSYYGGQSTTKQQASSNQKDWDEDASYGAEECNYMRTIAIYALAHIARSAPNHVQALLLPVFDNTYEPYQIRIAAFTTMMLSPVPEYTLERIASQMWREPSREVASFVVGTIDTLSKMTAPGAASYKYSAQKAADSMPKQYLDTWKFSWMAGGDHFDYQKDTGLTWAAEVVKSNVSSIPRAGYVHFGRYHGAAGSKYDNLFQIGFTSKGFESLLKQYLAYNEQQSADETNIVASVFETLYDTREDIVKYYREARDSVKESIMSTSSVSSKKHAKSNGLTGSANSNQDEDYYMKSKQPIDGVNSPAGRQQRQSENLFESLRSKRSITFQARTSSDDDEEAKLTVFSKLFDSTSYHALDKKEILALLEKSNDYLKMVADELVLGDKLHYVKMMMPSNMWHMVPSQMGLPVIVTHRTPIVASIKVDGSEYGQLTSNKLSQYYRQQATGAQVPNVQGQNFATLGGLNITAMVHPKVMHSNYRFMFAVEQACNEAYGVQSEKSHQLSTPMEVSVAYSQAKQLVSVAIEPKTPARMIWTKEGAKTFIGQISLANKQADDWLGQEHLVRAASLSQQSQYKRQHRQPTYVPSVLSGVQSLIQEQKESQRDAIEELETPYKFERSYVQQSLGLELHVAGVTDDGDVARAVSKPEMSKQSRGQSQWSSTDEVDELDQHSKSGQFSEYLHILESALNRPSKYLEFYTTLKPDQAHKSPVYRFDFVLNGNKQNQARRPVSRLNVKSQKAWQTIELSKKLNKIQQQQQVLSGSY